jgi:hypothetical protein
LSEQVTRLIPCTQVGKRSPRRRRLHGRATPPSSACSPSIDRRLWRYIFCLSICSSFQHQGLFCGRHLCGAPKKLILGNRKDFAPGIRVDGFCDGRRWRRVGLGKSFSTTGAPKRENHPRARRRELTGRELELTTSASV